MIGRRKILSVAVSSALFGMSGITLAQQAAAPAADVLEEVVVTGSRLARSSRSAAVPVQPIDLEQIRLTGAVNLETALNQMPQFVAGTTSASNSLASATGTGAATLDLRGLGAQRNLVLVNGRRYVFFDGTQVTNINTIPTSLVKRVEVVTGGASAVYGSDAIAGVTNFILMDDFEGIELQTQANNDIRGNGWTTDTTLTFGGNFDNGRGNAVVSLNYADREEIGVEERGFSEFVLANGTVNGEPALVRGGSSFIPSGRFSGLPANPSSRLGLTEALNAAGLGGVGGLGFTTVGDGPDVRPFQDPADRFNYAQDNFLRLPQERYAITALAHYDLTDNVRAYTEASYTYNETEVRFASSFINASLPFNVDNPFVSTEMQDVLRILDETEPGPGAGDGLTNLQVGRRLTELGPRRNIDERDAWRILLGLKGDFNDSPNTFVSGLSWDVYYSFARSDNTQTQIGNASISRFAENILNGTGPDGQPLVNPFGNNISPAGVDAIAVTSVNSDVTELEVLAGTIGGNIASLPAGDLGVSVGFEYRDSSLDFQPDQLLADGDIAGFNPITPASGSIEVWEVFGEVQVPLIAGAPMVEELTAKGAFRYSDYDLDQVGTKWTYFTGLDWALNDQVAFGVQFQRAIRAPSVGEAFGGQRQFAIQATDPCATPGAASDPTVRDLCIASGVPAANVGTPAVQPNQEVPGIFGGNPDLDAEESDTYTVSLILTPEALPGLRVTVDYFDIEVEDAIAPFGGSVGNVLNLCFNQLQDINSVACQSVGRDDSGAIQFPFAVTALNENIGAIETSGIDFQASYGFDADFGLFSDTSSFDLSVNVTWLDEFTLTPLQDQSDNQNACAGAFGSGTCGEPRPEFKTRSQLRWYTGNLTVGLTHRWLDEVDLDIVALRGVDPASIPVAEFSDQHYLDLSFNYDVGERISVWGGVNNLLDNDPPLLGANQRRANTFPDTYDPFGTELFLGASFRL
ncbi:TonB-dependent receptor domain-containing protein [Chromatocurvus halotolerans]|uniref:TonB-dependent receptor-like protein n=1 Tax=Chromatocurvus halotolerans TaxID=1132028 RepID=A0A4R2L5H6_9GAMM|nr:TonB-dependent receptor [Chromatocurvus halotolerans]TCO77888.1 TonB-dependent receptor-like protein [Chromatocurvus halotolerans]